MLCSFLLDNTRSYHALLLRLRKVRFPGVILVDTQVAPPFRLPS